MESGRLEWNFQTCMPPHDDSPFPRRSPEQGATMALWWLAAAILLVGGAAAYYFYSGTPPAPPPPQTPADPARVVTPANVGPAIRYPLEPAKPQLSANPLPPLDESDSALWETLAALLGKETLGELLKPEQIVRRIVATVDNLPRKVVASRVMPLTPTPGAFGVTGKDGSALIGAGNPARYAARVRVFQAIDVRRLVDLYLHFYPLFQKAYAELGYPERYFNDRLIEALDDLLAAPDIMTPIRLVQPKVLYQYADLEDEARSAGQKIMMRIGVGNEGLAKAKLREIRREILSRVPKQ